MIRPPFLKQGDTVGIVCTARKLSYEEVKPALLLAREWGLNVVLGDTIGLDNYQLGGTDAERAKDLNAMLVNPKVRAIWCARGGYGSVRIVDTIDFDLLLRDPKWLIGFSDVTVFHNQIHKVGLETIHGIMAFSVPAASAYSKESLRQQLFGEAITYQVPSVSHNRIGRVKGKLVGGNLSILYSQLGSRSSIDTVGKILFIEDLDEYLYHVDRMLYNLKRNGYFEELQGLIVGGMMDMHDNAIPFGQDATQLIAAIVQEYDFPVVFDFPSGHGQENWALRFGADIELEVNEEETIVTWTHG